MARIRSAKPELLEDEKAGPLPHDTWRLFVSTWLLADDYGNTWTQAEPCKDAKS